MKKIVITLQITDPETVEAYADVTAGFIYEDLLCGSLMEETELVSAIFITTD
jgi:hypothetical protein